MGDNILSHGRSCKMHIAIRKGDRDAVLKLLEETGDHLCTTLGFNCFSIASTSSTWNFVKFLLRQNPSGVSARNSNGETLLMYYAHRDIVVRELLQLGADPLSLSNSGKSALMFCIQSPEVNLSAVTALIEGGVNVNVNDEIGHNALTRAVMNIDSFNIEILSALIEAKTDPLVQLHDGGNLLTLSTKQYFKLWLQEDGIKITNTKMNTIGKAHTYLLKLPHFKAAASTFKFNCELEEHPQYLFLRHMSKYNNVNIFKEFFKPHFINKTMLIVSKLDESNMVGKEIENINYNFNPISWCLNYNDCLAADHLCNISMKGYVQKLLSYGFPANIPDSISPLTMLMSKHCSCHFSTSELSEFMYKGYKQGPEKNDILDTSRILIEKGVHVGQQLFSYCSSDTQSFSLELLLPDALYCALTFGHYHCLRLMLPYFGSPPLALLLFQTSFQSQQFCDLFPILAEWGPLPSGSRMLALMRQIFSNPDYKIHEAIRVVFNKLHSSPCTLKHLCRGVIRKSLALTARQDSSQNLVQLVNRICPLFLKNFMTMIPNEPLHRPKFSDPDLYNMFEILCGRRPAN